MSTDLVLLTIAAGVMVGVLSALLGVGGGLLMVPFMVLLLGETQHVAEGTSLAVIVPTAIVGVIALSRRGFVNFVGAGLLAVGGIFGAGLGARLALNLDGDVLKTVFGAVVIVMGARFVHQGLTTDPTAEPH